MPANGTANLIPLQRGQNPRLVLPNHKERGASFETQLERIANMRGGEVDGGDGKVTLNLEAHAWYKLLRDSRNDKDFDLVQRANALAKFSDRLHGKPLQRQELSGSLDHNLTGFIAFADIKDFAAMKQAVAEGRYLPHEDGLIPNPDFKELAESSSESQETE
ncbi:MAG: hypothetical protein KGJ13_04395 [Patescibacteria group bacterium]|nr:hypothetical protein [Patescibacteria group bacterium]